MAEKQNCSATKQQVISLCSDEEDAKPSATTTSRATQGYWKQNHADKWPTLEVAVFSYKYSLIQSDPFADSGALRELALNAMAIAFKTHSQFVIGQGMLEMVRASCANYPRSSSCPRLPLDNGHYIFIPRQLQGRSIRYRTNDVWYERQPVCFCYQREGMSSSDGLELSFP